MPRGPMTRTVKDRQRAAAKRSQKYAARAVTKHGAYKLQAADTSKWPAKLRRLHEERTAELLALPHIHEHHKGAVLSLVRMELIVSVLAQWIFTHGIITDEGDTAPAVRMLTLLENTLGRQYATLGLVPYTQRKLVDTRVQGISGLLDDVEGAEDAEDAEDEGAD